MCFFFYFLSFFSPSLFLFFQENRRALVCHCLPIASQVDAYVPETIIAASVDVFVGIFNCVCYRKGWFLVSWTRLGLASGRQDLAGPRLLDDRLEKEGREKE